MADKDEKEQEQRALRQRYGAELSDVLPLVKRTRPRAYSLVFKDLPGSEDPFLLLVFKRRKPAKVTAAKKEFKAAYGKTPDVVEGSVKLDGTTLVFEVPTGSSIPSRFEKHMRAEISEFAGRNYKVAFESVAVVSEADESDDASEIEDGEIEDGEIEDGDRAGTE